MSLSLVVVLLMTLGWSLVVGEFSLGQIVLGFGFGSFFVLMSGAGRGRRIPLATIPRRLYVLSLYLLVLLPYEIIRSNLDLTWRMLRRRPAIRPGIVGVRVGPVSEVMAAVVAHALTVGPGEVVIDAATDESSGDYVLYVHMIDVSQAEAREASVWPMYRNVIQRFLS